MDSHVCTIGILCPLARELEAVLASFDEGFKKVYDETERNQTTYYHGKLAGHDAVAVCLPKGEIGLEKIGAYAQRLDNRYPALLLRFLVGIAGGNPDVKHDIRLGDVVIGERIVNYRKGHLEENGNLRCAGAPYKAPKQLRDHLNDPSLRKQFEGTRLEEILRDMNTNYLRHVGNSAHSDEYWSRPVAEDDLLFEHDYSHRQPEASNCEGCDRRKLRQRNTRVQDRSKIHQGLIASADIVLKDGQTRHSLREHFNEILAVDMEASALEDFEYIVVRGICDYADTHKNDIWQDYAAAVAAACTKVLVESLRSRISRVDSTGVPGPSGHRTADEPSQGAYGSPERDPVEDSHLLETEPMAHPERVRTQSSVGQEEKTKVCSYSAVNVDLKKYNAQGQGNHSQEPLGECRLELWHCEGQKLHQTYRRLELTQIVSDQSNTTSLWLPLANVLVAREDSLVTLRYSDCNQLGWANEWHTEDGRNQYAPIYNPGNPNLKVNLGFPDINAAKDFVDNLLDLNHCIHREPLTELSTVDGEAARLYSVLPSGSRSPALLAFATLRHREYKRLKCQELVVCFIDDQLGFRIVPEQQAVKLVLKRYLETSYHPTRHVSAYWPPKVVKDNKDGSPASIGWGRSARSKSVTVALSIDDARHFMHTLTSGWQLQLIKSNVGFRAYSNWWQRKGDLEDCDLTVWRSNSQCRILVYKPALSKTSKPKWYACTLKNRSANSSHSTSTKRPNFEVDASEKSLTLPKVKQYSGNLLLRTGSDLLIGSEHKGEGEHVGHGTATASPSQEPELLTQIYKFNEAEDMEDFKKLLKSCVNTEDESVSQIVRSHSLSVEATAPYRNIPTPPRRSTFAWP